MASDVAVKRSSLTSLIALTFSCVFENSEPRKTNVLSLVVWTVLIVSAKEFCWAMRVEMYSFKSSLSLHSLKIERALHAASLKGLSRNRPAAPDAAINAGIRRRCRECPVQRFFFVLFCEWWCERLGNSKELKVVVCNGFCSFRRRSTQYSIDSAKPAILLTYHWCWRRNTWVWNIICLW